MDNPDLSIVFVCQAGELEIKAAVLAASIRYFHAHRFLDLVAAIPEVDGQTEPLTEETHTILAKLNVRIIRFSSPFGTDYLIGNKIVALGLPLLGQHTLFLDSDIICLKQIDLTQFCQHSIVLKPADFKYRFSDSEWDKIYQHFGLSIPDQRVFSSIDQMYIFPYFNAGVIAVPNAKIFSDTWLEIARIIDTDLTIENKRPWLDQLALPVAIRKLGLKTLILTERFNFPAHQRVLGDKKVVIFCHYHWPRVIQAEPVLLNKVYELAQKYPELRSLFRQDSEWEKLFQYKNKMDFTSATSSQKSYKNGKNIVITGLPRSGTSLLCNLLHRFDDFVGINEPSEIFSVLSDQYPIRKLELMYRDFRASIISGDPIENKIDKYGQIIEDTRYDERRSEYYPQIKNIQFNLVIKNNLALMARLPLMQNHSHDFQIIAMIRHPYDTIFSWKNSFQHLSNVTLESFPFGGEKDALLDSWQQVQINRIRMTECLITRRALLWRYLAQILIRNQYVTLLTYEFLTQNTILAITKLINAYSDQKVSKNLAAGVKYQSHSGVLSRTEKRIIKTICSEVAQYFDYQL